MFRAIKAFTLLEMMAAICVVLILVALAFPAFQKITPTAERIACINNLKNLRVAFSAYATEGWPQLPKEIALGSREEEQWWLTKTEKDLGLPKTTWQCPTIRRLFRSAPEKDRPLIHYLPTPFSGEPNKANSAGWEKMPWFIEIGNAHGQGNLLVRQNGTVEPASQ